MFKYTLALMVAVVGSFGAGIVSPELCFLILAASAILSLIMIFILLINGRTPLLNFWTLVAIATLFAAATASQIGTHNYDIALMLTLVLAGITVTAVSAARAIMRAPTATEQTTG